MRLLRMHWPLVVGIATLAGLVGLGMAQVAAARRGKPMYVELRRPQGQGPFPALVLLHGCSGITSVQRDWAERLSEWGYVCWSGRDGRGSYAERVQDARSALGYLRRQPFVDPRRIGAIGWSMGAG